MGFFSGIWKASYSISKGIVGAQNNAIGSLQSRRALKRIHKENEINRGITNYDVSDIEPFLSESGDIQNVIVSGLNNNIRNRAIVSVISNAYEQGVHTIVIHNGNQLLEQRIVSVFGANETFVVNANYPLYDPIVGLSDSEISRLIIKTAPEDCEISSIGKYYVEGMIDFLRSKGKEPSTISCMSCPHLSLIDNVIDAEKKGKITKDEAKRIIAQIKQGSSERANIENYFSVLKDQAYQLMAKRKYIGDALSLQGAEKKYSISTVDIMSDMNTLLIDVLAYELTILLSKRKKVLVVVDGLQLSSNEKLKNVVLNSGKSFTTVLSSDDLFASLGGNDDIFFSLAGKAMLVVLCKHSSAYSCQKWSDVIGLYDKQEVSESFSRNSGYGSGYTFGNSQTVKVEVQRENVVKPEEINRMQPNETYVINRIIGELAHTVIRV